VWVRVPPPALKYKGGIMKKEKPPVGFKKRCPCGMKRTKKGHDKCISNLPKVSYACCGHFDTPDKHQWISIPYLMFIVHPSLPNNGKEKMEFFGHTWGNSGNDFTALYGRSAHYAFDELQLFHGSKK
jgi:hypothetical protein